MSHPRTLAATAVAAALVATTAAAAPATAAPTKVDTTNGRGIVRQVEPPQRVRGWTPVARSKPCTRGRGATRVTARLVLWEKRTNNSNVQRMARITYSMPFYSRGLLPAAVTAPYYVGMKVTYPKGTSQRDQRKKVFRYHATVHEGVLQVGKLASNRPIKVEGDVFWATWIGGMPQVPSMMTGCTPKDLNLTYGPTKLPKKRKSSSGGFGGGGSFR